MTKPVPAKQGARRWRLDHFHQPLTGVVVRHWISTKCGNPISLVTMAQAHRDAAHWMEKLHIRAIRQSAKVVELSGGNQQKVVIAKSLIQAPDIIIFDEPTRGVDVGAIAEIHQLIQQLADAGAAVVVISSYLPEILAISDRILVARQGRIVEEMSIEDATEEMIMYAAVH
ncbi:sugar ABC transporter ATP-binding protein [Ensifer sp. ENS06]|nr:sugar ABC transporter ATP-binding protein [Ensifer sp. ENS06]